LAHEEDPVASGRVGTTLNDKWTLERLLGVGGMGAVYAGRHRNGATAAIKILHPELARNKVVRERFLREGYAANKVGHPGVVKVLDDDVVSSGPDEGAAYLVMELLVGESLQDRLEGGEPIDEREFLTIADGVLDVLQSAHKHGVVHRDLKPENLFFARDEGGKTRIKVLDFGLARLLQEQTITTYGLVLGTPSFMAPEQAAGKTPEIDGRTDLFALAATAFRLRTGRRIHEGDDPIDLVKKMATAPAPSLRSVEPGASEPFSRVIDKALQFKREDRYANAAAMQKDVRRALKELTELGGLKPPKAPPRLPAAKAKVGQATIEVSERDIVRPPPRGLEESVRIPKRRSILPWLLLLVLAGVGATIWYLSYQGAAADDSSASGAASSAPDAAALGVRGGPEAGVLKPRALGSSHPSVRTIRPPPTNLH
jgi:serine/threonine-protein kinase